MFYNIIRTTAFGMHVKKSRHCYILSLVMFIGMGFICKYTEINLYVENRIDKAIFNEDKLLCMYKWNSSKEIIDIYNDQGEIISNIDYSALMNENDEIELNEVLSILDERYVVFDATDYSGDVSYQCRVVYDITNNQFMLCNNSYIEFEGLIY